MNIDEVTTQIDEAIALCSRATNASSASPHSTGTFAIISEAAMTAITLVELVTGRGSTYHTQMSDTIKKYGVNSWVCLPVLTGVLKTLGKAVSQGLLVSIRSEIQGEMFFDFLERANQQLSEKNKDAAAVICGSVLEEHLRQLCNSNAIELDTEVNGGLKPKKADLLNSELTKASVYSKLDQKSITAWLDLRNQAAHGRYEEYEPQQVALMISGVRDFISRMNL